MFNIEDLEKIGSIECLYDSERMAGDEEMPPSNNDTLSRADSVAGNVGMTTYRNLDAILKSIQLGETGLAHRDSLQGNTYKCGLNEKMINDENLEDRRTSVKQVRM